MRSTEAVCRGDVGLLSKFCRPEKRVLLVYQCASVSICGCRFTKDEFFHSLVRVLNRR